MKKSGGPKAPLVNPGCWSGALRGVGRRKMEKEEGVRIYFYTPKKFVFLYSRME